MVRPAISGANALVGPAKTFSGLADLLVSSLEALAKTGQVDAACRLAGHACALLRKEDQGSWRKFNALLHRLSKRTAHPVMRNSPHGSEAEGLCMPRQDQRPP
jgi:hypothetical protein